MAVNRGMDKWSFKGMNQIYLEQHRLISKTYSWVEKKADYIFIYSISLMEIKWAQHINIYFLCVQI